MQLMPGTYIGTDNKVHYNPSALINGLFRPYWNGEYFAYGHTERKFYISIFTIFGPHFDIKHMTAVSELKFCPACTKMGINFLDLYNIFEIIGKKWEEIARLTSDKVDGPDYIDF